MSPGVIDKTQFLGFLTVKDDARRGLIGGYLVLNVAGRPVGFHCTAPVKPNRAQEILYGTSLRTYLYGEQIAQTLIGTAAQSNVVTILTNTPEVLAAREFTDSPIIYVFGASEPESPPLRNLLDINELHEKDDHFETVPGLDVSDMKEVRIQNNRLLVPQDDNRNILEQLELFSRSIDYAEPFVRLKLAIEETQRAA